MNADLYSKRPNLIIGFHGCDQSIVEKVLNGKEELKRSTNDYDWLGEGIYFWQNSQERAIQYANEAKERKNSNITNPAVIGAIIDLGLCLDLLDYKHLQDVKRSYEVLKADSQNPLPENKMEIGGTKMLRYLDKTVIQSVHTARKDQYQKLQEMEARIRALIYMVKSSKYSIEDYIECTNDFVDSLRSYSADTFESDFTEERKNAFINIITNQEKKDAIHILEQWADNIKLNSSLVQPYDSVRSTFLEGQELYPDAGFREKNHIQICIRNTNCIKGYFLPKDMDECYPNP